MDASITEREFCILQGDWKVTPYFIIYFLMMIFIRKLSILK